MANFPYPNESIDSIIDLMKYDNDVTKGWFGIMILIMFWVIAFLSLKGFESKQAFAGASFFVMLMAVFFKIMGILSTRYFWFPILMVVLSVFWLVFSKEQTV